VSIGVALKPGWKSGHGNLQEVRKNGAVSYGRKSEIAATKIGNEEKSPHRGCESKKRAVWGREL